MIQDNLLSIYADAHLLGYVFKPVHESLLCILQVMIPEYKVDLPAKAVIGRHPLPPTSKGEIAQMEDRTVLRDRFIPIPDQCLIHLFYRLKGTVAEFDNPFVEKMCVRCKEQILSRELVLEKAYLT